MSILFINGKIIVPDGILENHAVLIEGSKIVEVAPQEDFVLLDHDLVDLEGEYLSAGFIDVHCHGGNSYDFMDATEEAIKGIANFHNLYGTTSMYATTLSGGEAETLKFLEVFTEVAPKVEAMNLLGVHLEGPYFAMSQKGAQDSKFIVNPDKEQYLKYLEFDCVKRWSIAPERPGALELGDELKKRNITASIAHTEALYEDCVKALDHGYNSMTHLYSAMLGVTRIDAYRHAGAIEAGLFFDEYFVEVIADGSHLPISLLQYIYKNKPKDKIMLITDAMRGAGLPAGSASKLGSLDHGQDVLILEDVAMMPDKSSFAGSIATADRLVRVMANDAKLPLHEVINMISKNPAIHMGVGSHKGQVKVGYDADFAIFDKNINVSKTVVMGKIRAGIASR